MTSKNSGSQRSRSREKRRGEIEEAPQHSHLIHSSQVWRSQKNGSLHTIKEEVDSEKLSSDSRVLRVLNGDANGKWDVLLRPHNKLESEDGRSSCTTMALVSGGIKVMESKMHNSVPVLVHDVTDKKNEKSDTIENRNPMVLDLHNELGGFKYQWRNDQIFTLPEPLNDELFFAAKEQNALFPVNAQLTTLFGTSVLTRFNVECVDEKVLEFQSQSPTTNPILWREKCQWSEREYDLNCTTKLPNPDLSGSATRYNPSLVGRTVRVIRHRRHSDGALAALLKIDDCEYDSDDEDIPGLCLGTGAYGAVYKGWLTREGRDILGQGSFCEPEVEDTSVEVMLPVACKLEPLCKTKVKQYKHYSHRAHSQLRYMEISRRKQLEMTENGLLRVYAQILVDGRLGNGAVRGLRERRRTTSTDESDSDDDSEKDVGMLITVMELAPPNAVSLEKMIRPENMDVREPQNKNYGAEHLPFLVAKDIFSRVMRSVKYLQNLQLLHLDLKPSNIMIQLADDFSHDSEANNVNKKKYDTAAARSNTLRVFLVDYDNVVSAQQYQRFRSVRSSASMTETYCAPERFWDRFDILQDPEKHTARDIRGEGVAAWRKQNRALLASEADSSVGNVQQIFLPDTLLSANSNPEETVCQIDTWALGILAIELFFDRFYANRCIMTIANDIALYGSGWAQVSTYNSTKFSQSCSRKLNTIRNPLDYRREADFVAAEMNPVLADPDRRIQFVVREGISRMKTRLKEALGNGSTTKTVVSEIQTTKQQLGLQVESESSGSSRSSTTKGFIDFSDAGAIADHVFEGLSDLMYPMLRINPRSREMPMDVAADPEGFLLRDTVLTPLVTKTTATVFGSRLTDLSSTDMQCREEGVNFNLVLSKSVTGTDSSVVLRGTRLSESDLNCHMKDCKFEDLTAKFENSVTDSIQSSEDGAGHNESGDNPMNCDDSTAETAESVGKEVQDENWITLLLHPESESGSMDDLEKLRTYLVDRITTTENCLQNHARWKLWADRNCMILQATSVLWRWLLNLAFCTARCKFGVNFDQDGFDKELFGSLRRTPCGKLIGTAALPDSDRDAAKSKLISESLFALSDLSLWFPPVQLYSDRFDVHEQVGEAALRDLIKRPDVSRLICAYTMLGSHAAVLNRMLVTNFDGSLLVKGPESEDNHVDSVLELGLPRFACPPLPIALNLSEVRRPRLLRTIWEKRLDPVIRTVTDHLGPPDSLRGKFNPNSETDILALKEFYRKYYGRVRDSEFDKEVGVQRNFMAWCRATQKIFELSDEMMVDGFVMQFLAQMRLDRESSFDGSVFPWLGFPSHQMTKVREADKVDYQKHWGTSVLNLHMHFKS